MNSSQAKCIPIADYLAREGFQPARSRQGGRELWYRSPVRDGDENPSFKVDTTLNLWFDHGLARGGNIIELIKERFQCDVRDALFHLEKTGLFSPVLDQPKLFGGRAADGARRDTKARLAGEKEKEGSIELVSSSPLKHPALLQYLTKRGIDHEVARQYLSQIDFKPPGSPGTYFALGFPAGDGFEARNALFKGFVGTGKSVTFHDKADASLLQVFEGFMDFLTYLTLRKSKSPEGAVLVLNSTNLWRRALPYLQDQRFSDIRLYLDNDAAGTAATDGLTLEADRSCIQDMRSHYADAEDLNAWHLSRSS